MPQLCSTSIQDSTKQEYLPLLMSMNTSLLYQFRISNRSFLSVGLMPGLFQLYIGAKQGENIRTFDYILPVLTYDYRF